MTGLLGEVGVGRVIVAIDPGKALNRVWVTNGDGLFGVPVTLPSSRDGVDELGRLLVGQDAPLIALEATGSLHRAWMVELERRWPGSVRLFAPSETQAARAQFGTRRFKTDDRDCAALVWLARQGAGRPARACGVEALRAAVAHRRQLLLALKPLRQRLHDQRNALAPGLSAPPRHGRQLPLDTPTGHAVLACAAVFAGRCGSNWFGSSRVGATAPAVAASGNDWLRVRRPPDRLGTVDGGPRCVYGLLSEEGGSGRRRHAR